MSDVPRERIRFPGVFTGGTSWVKPGTFAENMREVSRDADAMQFVLFDCKYGSNIPSKDEVRALAELKHELTMEVVVHFPDNIELCKGDVERTRGEDSCLRIMELFAPLEPYAWVGHFLGAPHAGYPRFPAADMDSWNKNIRQSMSRLALASNTPRRICAETLDYNFNTVYSAALDCGISVCLDIGHIIRYRYNVLGNLAKYLPLTRVLHIHGVGPDGTDHVDMSAFDVRLFHDIITRLGEDGITRVMILEVFEDDWRKSVEAVRKLATCT